MLFRYKIWKCFHIWKKGPWPFMQSLLRSFSQIHKDLVTSCAHSLFIVKWQELLKFSASLTQNRAQVTFQRLQNDTFNFCHCLPQKLFTGITQQLIVCHDLHLTAEHTYMSVIFQHRRALKHSTVIYYSWLLLIQCRKNTCIYV